MYKRVYLSGPMSGIPGFNIPLFDKVADDLRCRGLEVVSPAELDSLDFREACLKSDGKTIPPGGDTWGTLLARDVILLADDGIEAVIVLPGWVESRGANLETFVARLCGLPILQYPHLKPVPTKTLEIAHAQAGVFDEF